MKRYMYIISSLLLLIFLSAFNLHAILTKFNNEIDADLRKKIRDLSTVLIENIKSGNTGAIGDLLSNELSEREKQDISNIFAQVRPVFMKFDFELFDEYYSFISSVGKDEVYTIIPEEKDSFIVQGVRIPSKHSYIQFWKSDNAGFQYLTFLRYVKEGEEWKLIQVHFGDYAIQGQPAPALVAKCRGLHSDKKYMSSAIYALATQKVMRPAPFLQYKKENAYMETLRTVLGEINQRHRFPISLKGSPNASLFSVDMTVTTSGISPVLKYTTSKDLNLQEAVSEEATILFPEIQSMSPDLIDSFEYIILQAYNELPFDPNKKYESYNTIFKDGKRFQKNKDEGSK